MRIVKFKAENVKRLKVVEIIPKGGVIQISGPNASGKSSVLDSIFYCLTGAKNIPSCPIRQGETSAMVKLDLGEIKVTRKFLPDGKTTLTVEAGNGGRFGSPQSMLDSLVGDLSFDPLQFTRMAPKDQLETLKRIVPLDVDIAALEGANQREYEERAEVNREIVRLKGQLAGLLIPPTAQADLELDESALLKELGDAATTNGNIERVKLGHSQAVAVSESIERQLKEAQALVARLSKELDEQNQKVSLCANQVSQLREPIDVGELKNKMERARIASTSKRTLAERDRVTALLQTHVDRADTLTQSMTSRLKAKEEAIARAKMPVTGLSFGEGEVLFKGVPFNQASQAEQLVVSTVIAMAANPRLRIIRIQDGSLLDEKNLGLIGKLAQKGDYQVWIEVVQSSDPMAIHMEDGAVVEKSAIEVA